MTEAKKPIAVPKKAVKKDDIVKVDLWSTFTKGIWKENSIFVMVLGMCPSLAVTSTLEAGLGMGILVFIILTISNLIISSIRKFVPSTVRIPSYVVIIATEVTALQMLVNAFASDLGETLGVYLALIVVNCIILGRAEAFASKNKVVPSILDGMGTSIGFALSLTIIGFVREFFGTGMIKLGYILPLPFQIELFGGFGLSKYSIGILTAPPGGFLIIGLLLAVFTAKANIKKAKEAEKEKAEKIKKALEIKAKLEAAKAAAAAKGVEA
ncbi:MAG: electron transport complex subunit RsxE [Acholeplasmataceae bacterium]